MRAGRKRVLSSNWNRERDNGYVPRGARPSVAAGRTEGERSEPEGRTGATDGGRRPPNPEVAPVASRRTFTAEYKRRILAEVEAAKEGGAVVGRILRREGLYSSHLAAWRKEREHAERAALEPKKRGPKGTGKEPLLAENAKLPREKTPLRKKTSQTHAIR